MTKATTISDVIRLKIHHHQKKEHPETLLRSVQLENLNIGFKDAKEIYHIEHRGTANAVTRGKHAHYKKRELFQILYGTCKLTVKDSKSEKTIALSSSDEVIYIPTLIWHEIEFKEKAMLLVISSTMYHEEERALDYIENFEDYKEAKSIF